VVDATAVRQVRSGRAAELGDAGIAGTGASSVAAPFDLLALAGLSPETVPASGTEGRGLAAPVDTAVNDETDARAEEALAALVAAGLVVEKGVAALSPSANGASAEDVASEIDIALAVGEPTSSPVELPLPVAASVGPPTPAPLAGEVVDAAPRTDRPAAADVAAEILEILEAGPSSTPAPVVAQAVMPADPAAAAPLPEATASVVAADPVAAAPRRVSLEGPASVAPVSDGESIEPVMQDAARPAITAAAPATTGVSSPPAAVPFRDAPAGVAPVSTLPVGDDARAVAVSGETPATSPDVVTASIAAPKPADRASQRTAAPGTVSVDAAEIRPEPVEASEIASPVAVENPRAAEAAVAGLTERTASQRMKQGSPSRPVPSDAADVETPEAAAPLVGPAPLAAAEPLPAAMPEAARNGTIEDEPARDEAEFASAAERLLQDMPAADLVADRRGDEPAASSSSVAQPMRGDARADAVSAAAVPPPAAPVLADRGLDAAGRAVASASMTQADKTSDAALADQRSRAFERQVLAALRQGRDEVRVALYPPQLGQVVIRLALDGQKVRVSMRAANGDAEDVLQAGEARLRDALGQEGFELSGFDVAGRTEDEGRRAPRRPYADVVVARNADAVGGFSIDMIA